MNTKHEAGLRRALRDGDIEKFLRKAGRGPKKRKWTVRRLNASEQQFVARCQTKSVVWYRSGWPDFLCEIDGGLIGVEVKQGVDRLKPAQVRMHAALERAGIPVYVWNPDLSGVLVRSRRYSGTLLRDGKTRLRRLMPVPAGTPRALVESPRGSRQV